MLYWLGIVFVWIGAVASTAFLLLYLCTARWWDSMVGVSLISHAAAMVLLFSVAATVTTSAGPVELAPLAFAVVTLLSGAEVLQSAVFYGRWWRTRKTRPLHEAEVSDGTYN